LQYLRAAHDSMEIGMRFILLCLSVFLGASTLAAAQDFSTEELDTLRAGREVAISRDNRVLIDSATQSAFDRCVNVDNLLPHARDLIPLKKASSADLTTAMVLIAESTYITDAPPETVAAYNWARRVTTQVGVGASYADELIPCGPSSERFVAAADRSVQKWGVASKTRQEVEEDERQPGADTINIGFLRRMLQGEVQSDLTPDERHVVSGAVGNVFSKCEFGDEEELLRDSFSELLQQTRDGVARDQRVAQLRYIGESTAREEIRCGSEASHFMLVANKSVNPDTTITRLRYLSRNRSRSSGGASERRDRLMKGLLGN